MLLAAALAGLLAQASTPAVQLTVEPRAESLRYRFENPSSFDTVGFYDQSSDPGQVGFASAEWDFGDGGTASNPGCCPSHRYFADGDYTVRLTVTTLDGRTASTTRVVQVRTHDVAIAKLTVWTSASLAVAGKSGRTSVAIAGSPRARRAVWRT